MLQIPIDRLDELHKISIELGILAYLRYLVDEDERDCIDCEQDTAIVRQSVNGYLNTVQFDAVERLRDLINRENFVRRIDMADVGLCVGNGFIRSETAGINAFPTARNSTFSHTIK